MAEIVGGDAPTRESFSEVVQRLATSQKSGRGAPAYSRFINRPLGRRFAAIAYLAGVTPNVVTLISGTFTASAIILLLFVHRSIALGIGVSLLLVIGYGLDAADGQLARLTGGGSLSGEWLDHMVDCVKASSLHLAVAVNIFRFWGVRNSWLIVPVVLTVLDSTAFFGQILGEQLKRSRGTATSSGSSSLFVSMLKMPTDYGILCLIFVLFGINWLFLGAYTVMAVAGAIYLILVLPRWYNQIAALDRSDRP